MRVVKTILIALLLVSTTQAIPTVVIGGDTDTTYSEISPFLILTGTVFDFNETLLNDTINALENDTTYLAEENYIYLDGTTFRFNESLLNETINLLENDTTYTNLSFWLTEIYEFGEYLDQGVKTNDSVTFADVLITNNLTVLANTNVVNITHLNATGHFVPFYDSTYDLGSIARRWDDIYATSLSGTLAWSDLTSYPSACEANETITVLGDTITCSSIVITEAQISDLTHTVDTQKYGGGIYLYNNTTSIILNETKLNETISLLDTDTDTTYTAEELYIYLDGTTFRLNETVLNSTIDNRDDQPVYFGANPYIYINASNYIFLNDTVLNDTIDSRDSDTTYLAEELYIYLDGTTFRLNESVLNATIDDRDDQPVYFGALPYIYINASNYIFLNDTVLNETIDARDDYEPDTDTQKYGGSPYLYNDSTTIYLNDTVLNDTIDSRDTDTDTHIMADSSSNFLSDNYTTMFFNESFLNDTIDARSISVDTQKYGAFPELYNNTTHIILNQTWLNSTIDDRTIPDTNTEKGGFGPYLYNDSDFIYLNESILNNTIDARDDDTVYTAEEIYIYLDSFTFRLNETLLNQTIDSRDDQPVYFGGDPYIFINASNYIFLNDTVLNDTIDSRVIPDTNTEKGGGGIYLYNDSDFIYLNETVLNDTIDARDNYEPDTDTQKYGGGIYLYNNTSYILLNETVLNATIDAREIDTDTNTLYNSNNLYIWLNLSNNNTFYLNESVLNSTIDSRDSDTLYFAGEPYIYLNSSNYFFINETVLNATIDDRDNFEADTDTKMFGSFPELYNNTTHMFLNQTWLNDTIDDRVTPVTDTQKYAGGIYLYNNTTHIFVNETILNDTIDARDNFEADTDTRMSSVGPYLYNNTSHIFFNETYLNNTIDLRDSDTTYTAEELYIYLDSTTFRLNETLLNNTIDLRDDDTTYSEISNYLILTGTVFDFNETYLNNTIDARDTDTNTHIEADPNSNYLTDNFTYMFFNETLLNDTIDLRAVSGTDTQKYGAGPYLYNNTSYIILNETYLNQTIELFQNITNYITVSIDGINTNYDSIKEAVDSITGATAANHYEVIVYPGTYYENNITLPDFVTLKSSGFDSAVISNDTGFILNTSCNTCYVQDIDIDYNPITTDDYAIIINHGTVEFVSVIFDLDQGANNISTTFLYLTGGTTIVRDSLMNFNDSFNNASQSEDHDFFDVDNGTLQILGGKAEISISDSEDDYFFIDDDSFSNFDMIIDDFEFRLEYFNNTGDTDVRFLDTRGSSINRFISDSFIELRGNESANSSGTARAIVLNSDGNNGEVHSFSNTFHVLGFGTNEYFRSFSGDTIFTYFDHLIADDESSGSGDIIGTTSPRLNDFEISDDLYIGQRNSSDDDYIYFDTNTNKYFAWMQSRGQFEIDDDLVPDNNNSRDLGASDRIWAQVHADEYLTYSMWEDVNDTNDVFDNVTTKLVNVTRKLDNGTIFVVEELHIDHTTLPEFVRQVPTKDENGSYILDANGSIVYETSNTTYSINRLQALLIQEIQRRNDWVIETPENNMGRDLGDVNHAFDAVYAADYHTLSAYNNTINAYQALLNISSTDIVRNGVLPNGTPTTFLERNLDHATIPNWARETYNKSNGVIQLNSDGSPQIIVQNDSVSTNRLISLVIKWVQEMAEDLNWIKDVGKEIVKCPDGFTKYSLGCIQTNEQGSDTALNAITDCYASHEGRLPTGQEWSIGVGGKALNNETDNDEWLGDVAFTDAGAQRCVEVNAQTSTNSYSRVTCGSTNAYRCFIPFGGGT